MIPNPIAEAYKSHYKMNNSNNVCEFIAAGRIGKQKNYELMIKAFSIACKKNANIRLRIFGTGSDEYLDYLKRIILENNVEQNIFFMGRSNSMEVEYKKSDVFLMTSDFEGLPNALMEAMASKLICISTDCKTGPRDLIDDGKNGFLSPVGNVLSFAEKIEYVMEMGLVQRKKWRI